MTITFTVKTTRYACFHAGGVGGLHSQVGSTVASIKDVPPCKTGPFQPHPHTQSANARPQVHFG